MKRATFTGWVGRQDGPAVLVVAGTTYGADDALVVERPDLFEDAAAAPAEPVDDQDVEPVDEEDVEDQGVEDAAAAPAEPVDDQDVEPVDEEDVEDQGVEDTAAAPAEPVEEEHPAPVEDQVVEQPRPRRGRRNTAR